MFSDGVEIFLSFYKTGNLSETAQIFGLSASAVSRQIAGLEKYLGADLIDRSRKPVTLSDEGRTFAFNLSTHKEKIDELLFGVRKQNNAKPILKTGFLESFVRLSPDFIYDSRDYFSSVTSLSGTTDRLKNLLKTHEVGLIVSSDPFADEGSLRRLFLLREPSLLVIPRDSLSFLASEDSWARLRLIGLPYISSSHKSVSGIATESFLSATGIGISRRYEVDNVGVKLSLIGKGLGWSIVPVMSLYQNKEIFEDLNGRKIQTFPMPAPVLFREIFVLSNLNIPSSLLRRSASLLSEIITNSVVPWVQDKFPWTASDFVVNTSF